MGPSAIEVIMDANKSEELERLFDLRRPPVMQEQEADRASSGRRNSSLDVNSDDNKEDNVDRNLARPHSPGMLAEPAEASACTPHSRKLEQRTASRKIPSRTTENQSSNPSGKNPSKWDIVKNISLMGGWPERTIQAFQDAVDNVIERAAAKSNAKTGNEHPRSYVGLGGSSVTTQPGVSSIESMFPRVNLTVALDREDCQRLRARLDTGSDLNIMGESAASRLTDVDTLEDCEFFEHKVRGISAALPIRKVMKFAFFINFVPEVRKATVYIVEDCYIDNRFDVLLGEQCIQAYDLLREGPGLLQASNPQGLNAGRVDMTHDAAAQIEV